MRHLSLSLFLSVRQTTKLGSGKLLSRSYTRSWDSVADNIPKTYAVQAKKAARILEEKFQIAENGKIVNIRSGEVTKLSAEDLMSFYVTKKKTKITPANLKEIVEDLNEIHLRPLHNNSRKVYDEARIIAEKAIREEAKRESLVETVSPSLSSVPVIANLDQVVKEKEKEKQSLHFESVTDNDLHELLQQDDAVIEKTESEKIEFIRAEPDVPRGKPIPEPSQLIQMEESSEVVSEEEKASVQVEAEDDSTEVPKSIRAETESPRNEDKESSQILKGEDQEKGEDKPVQVEEDSRGERSPYSREAGMYLMVGVSIALLVYIFKAREEKLQPSAEENQIVLGVEEVKPVEEEDQHDYDIEKVSSLSEESDSSPAIQTGSLDGKITEDTEEDLTLGKV